MTNDIPDISKELKQLRVFIQVIEENKPKSPTDLHGTLLDFDYFVQKLYLKSKFIPTGE
jgi:hypothetical protein